MKNGKFESGELSRIISESGITYSKISSCLGVFPQNIHQWVTFKRPIPEKYHHELATFLLECLKIKRSGMNTHINKLTNYLED